MSERTTSRLPVWLIVSIVANALLIGLLIGGGMGQRRAGPPPNALIGGEQTLMRGIDRSVPDEQRRAVRKAFRRAFVDSRQERLRVQSARRNLNRLLGAETFDAEAVRDGFAELRAADNAMKARMHDVLAEQFGALTPEQRQAVLRDNRRGGERPRFRDRDRER
ncbi:MAG: periplasmic heavy metal sensor [Pseudomonadota bacterium]